MLIHPKLKGKVSFPVKLRLDQCRQISKQVYNVSPLLTDPLRLKDNHVLQKTCRCNIPCLVYDLKFVGPLEFELVAPMPEQLKTTTMHNYESPRKQ